MKKHELITSDPLGKKRWICLILCYYGLVNYHKM